jgi:DNA repair protein RadC
MTTLDPLTIQDLPESERPREKLLRQGADALSNSELLALVLRTGAQGESVLRLAERVLARVGGLHGLLRAAPADLSGLHGLGETKLTQLLAVAELARRLSALSPQEHPVIRSAEDASRLFMDMAYLPQEHVRVLLLDSARRAITISTVYIGTLHTTALRVAEVYREAIARSAAALILAHNHPSGDPSPSPEDIAITRTLTAAGELLDIQFIDHLIIARDGWRSLRNAGLGI